MTLQGKQLKVFIASTGKFVSKKLISSYSSELDSFSMLKN
jgi:hypothetical protein